jgi:hypothetical protein
VARGSPFLSGERQICFQLGGNSAAEKQEKIQDTSVSIIRQPRRGLNFSRLSTAATAGPMAIPLAHEPRGVTVIEMLFGFRCLWSTCALAVPDLRNTVRKRVDWLLIRGHLWSMTAVNRSIFGLVSYWRN